MSRSADAADGAGTPTCVAARAPGRSPTPATRALAGKASPDGSSPWRVAMPGT